MRAVTKKFTFHQATDEDLLELHYSSRSMLLDPDVPVNINGNIIRENRFGSIHAFIARDETGRIAGYSLYRINKEHEAELLRTSTTLESRTLGIGKKLFGLMKGHLLKLGAKNLSLSATHSGVGFYQRLKFNLPPEKEINRLRSKKMLIPLNTQITKTPRARLRKPRQNIMVVKKRR